jgi:tetratricopeptide (TPR) repeat protein
VRTVQLWEKKEGLPVHRHHHQRLGSVFAFRSEIDQWKQSVSRHSNSNEKSVAEPAPSSKRTLYLPQLEDCSPDGKFESICETVAKSTLKALRDFNSEQLIVIGPLDGVPNSSIPSPRFGAFQYELAWRIEAQNSAPRILISLRCADKDEPIWCYTHVATDLASSESQSQLANLIARCVWLKVIQPVRQSSASDAGDQGAARKAYLKGRYFWQQRNEQSMRKAIRYFKSAIRYDSRFALSYSGLADALTLLSFYEIARASEVMPHARRAALTAIELNSNLAEAHVSLADVLLHFDRDWDGAEREYRRAIQCNPDYALGYHWYSNLLAARGQHDAAHAAIMNALDLNPVCIITTVWAGVTSHLARQFDTAIAHYKDALELDPHFVWAHMYMGQALEQKGDFRAALREFESAISLAGGSNCVKAMKAHTFAIAGDKSSARELLHEVQSTSPDSLPSYDIAAAYAALAEPDRMMSWLRKACDDHNMKLFTLPQDPRFDEFRRRRDFKEVVQRIGLGHA